MAAKVYCTLKGGAIQIGNFGVTSLSEDGTVEVPVLVSDEVATEIEQEIRGEGPNPRFGEKGEPPLIPLGTGARKDVRVVRDTPPAPKAVKVAPLAEKKE
jgi:hypothetical protein